MFQASLMGVSGTTTATTTIPSYEPVRRDSFRPPSLEAADNSLGLASSLSPVEEQVSHLYKKQPHAKTDWILFRYLLAYVIRVLFMTVVLL